MVKKEWQQLWHSRRMLIGLILIALIPAIYCLLYLSSMWDAYGKMDRIPVAIVNQDQPQSYRGKRIAIGKQLTTKLRRSNSLDYHVTTAKTAAAGIRNGKYYMVVTIPKRFSSDATTLLTSSPQRLHIRYTVNSGRNFVVSKMTSGAAKAIQSKVSNQVSTMYVGALLTTIGHVQTGMANAAKGSSQVTTGLTSLTNGIQQVGAGTTSLQQGLQTANVASPELVGGVGKLNAALAKLHDGSSTLTLGSTRLTTSLAGSNNYMSNVRQLTTSLRQSLLTQQTWRKCPTMEQAWHHSLLPSDCLSAALV